MGPNKSKIKRPTHVKYENISFLEDLSNELILELFDYFSFNDINLIFANLNKRFNDLINTYPHYINLQNYTFENLHLLPHHIRSLKICGRYQIPFLNNLNITLLRALSISNLLPEQYIFVLNSIPLNQLDYIYLSICPSSFGNNQEDLAFIQKKILSLGEIKLKKCVFRMRLIIDIDQLPLQLCSLEYLRIDGCQNVSIINNLLNHMPNLKYFRGLIFESVKTQNDYLQIIPKTNSLIYIVIQICELKSPDELIPLFVQHCSNVKKLIIYLNSITKNDPADKISDIQFVNQYHWINNIINQYLLQLKSFQIRQRVCSQINGYQYMYQPCYVPPYQEKLQYPPIDVSIAGKVASLWQNSA